MKQFRIPFAVVFVGILLSTSGCLPKSGSSSGSSGSTSTSSVNGNGGGLNGTTPTPTVTPFATVTGVSCNDPIGDCTGMYPVIQVVGISKKQPHTNTPTEAGSFWVSTADPAIGNGSALITDARLRYRVKVNAQTSRASCGITSGSYNPYPYQKLKMTVTVKRGDNGAVCHTSFVGPTNVGSTSSIIDVPTSCVQGIAAPPIIQMDSILTDSYCLWQLSSQYNVSYCANTPAACGCPAALPDPTNCWSADLQVVTSRTGDFKP